MPVYHTYRSDGFGNTKSAKLTPIKAIRQQCKECYGFSPSYFTDIENCPSELCPLYPFRLGKDPSKKPSRRGAKANLKNLEKARSAGGVAPNMAVSQQRGG